MLDFKVYIIYHYISTAFMFLLAQTRIVCSVCRSKEQMLPFQAVQAALLHVLLTQAIHPARHLQEFRV